MIFAIISIFNYMMWLIYGGVTLRYIRQEGEKARLKEEERGILGFKYGI